MSPKIVIIGGDAAGMSVAAKVMREAPQTELVVFERSPHISYAACGMPYWFSGVVSERSRLLAVTLDEARQKRGIDVRVNHEVRRINRREQTVTVRDLDGERTWEEPYDRLVIATGASAVKPPVPGTDLPGVFTLRSLQDGDRIHDYLQRQQPRRGIIVGAGYIGLEMAESFRSLGMETTVVEMLEQIMPNMDGDMVGEVAQHLADQGVTLRTGARVTAIRSGEAGLAVEIQGEQEALMGDIVLISVGVRPNSELARDAGLELGTRDAIRVDDHLRTNDPHIYAAGDCVAYHHRVLGEDSWIPLAPSANKGGRIVAENLLGQDSVFPGILGTAVVKVFDYSLAVTGLTETQARSHAESFAGGIAVRTVTAPDRPHYYPGGQPVRVKTVIERATGRLLGAQLVSRSDVAKRADIFAVAITAGMTVQEFGMLDLTYAPPFAPTYDPVLVAANVAQRDVEA